MIEASTITGKPLSEVQAMSLDFETSYPIVDTKTMTVIGIVDGNYPDDYNNGK